MKKIFLSLSATTFMMIASVATVRAQGDIMDVASANMDCSRLVEMIKTADMIKTFRMASTITVFAPSNAAFEKLPAEEFGKLLKSKTALSQILKCHIVGGNWNSTTLMNAVKQNNGSVQLPVLSGGRLTATVEDGKIKITDENGGSAFISNADITASNGIIHIVDGVVQPVKAAITKRN